MNNLKPTITLHDAVLELASALRAWIPSTINVNPSYFALRERLDGLMESLKATTLSTTYEEGSVQVPASELRIGDITVGVMRQGIKRIWMGDSRFRVDQIVDGLPFCKEKQLYESFDIAVVRTPRPLVVNTPPVRWGDQGVSGLPGDMSLRVEQFTRADGTQDWIAIVRSHGHKTKEQAKNHAELMLHVINTASRPEKAPVSPILPITGMQTEKASVSSIPPAYCNLELLSSIAYNAITNQRDQGLPIMTQARSAALNVTLAVLQMQRDTKDIVILPRKEYDEMVSSHVELNRFLGDALAQIRTHQDQQTSAGGGSGQPGSATGTADVLDHAPGRGAEEPGTFPEGCEYNGFSSRTCERGTRRCVVKHEEDVSMEIAKVDGHSIVIGHDLWNLSRPQHAETIVYKVNKAHRAATATLQQRCDVRESERDHFRRAFEDCSTALGNAERDLAAARETIGRAQRECEKLMYEALEPLVVSALDNVLATLESKK